MSLFRYSDFLSLCICFVYVVLSVCRSVDIYLFSYVVSYFFV